MRWRFNDRRTVSLYPRRIRLGLIEVVSLADHWRFQPAAYPRRIRLGLIEVYPGRYPPQNSFATYPRRIRLGLIEVAIDQSRIGTTWGSIRGAFASASLKYVAAPDSLKAHLPIRGAFASASLKCIGGGGVEDAVGLLSEAHSPRPH